MTPAQFARLYRTINNLADETSDALGPFIAGPEPQNPIAAHYHRYTRWVCDSYAQVPDWVRNAAPAVTQAGIEASIGDACRQYLGDGMPTASPPFVGGQCPTRYNVTVVYTDQFRNLLTNPWVDRWFSAVRNVMGPIQGIVESAQGALIQGTGDWAFTGFSNPSQSACVTNPNHFRNCKIEIVSCVRADGLPDNCGNRRPKLPTRSPSAPPDPGPPPGGGQPPLFGPRGTPIFRPGPFRSPYDEDDEDCPPIDPYHPDDGDEEDPYYGPDRPKPGDPGDPGDPRNTGDGGDTEGEAPPDTELVGLKINLTKIPSHAKQYADGVYRGALYAYMGTNAGLDQDYAGSMVSDGQFILAERPGLTKWRVVANPGYSVRVTPYYREVI